MNIARALGDKFLKEEGAAFSAEPYISNVFRLSGDGLGLVVMARYVTHTWVLDTDRLHDKKVLMILYIGESVRRPSSPPFHTSIVDRMCKDLPIMLLIMVVC